MESAQVNVSNPPPGSGFDFPRPVLGKIAPEPEALGVLMEGFAECCRANQKQKGAESYVRSLRALFRDAGIASVEDLTAARLQGFIDSKRTSGHWGPGMAKVTLAVVRAFDRYLQLQGREPIKALDLIRAKKRPADRPSRAASTADRDRMFSQACAESDGRRRGNHILYLACLYMGGMRADEPERLQWGRHVQIDGEVPTITWTADMHKAGRNEEVAIHPDLARLLREHREMLRQTARATKLATSPRRKREARAVDPDAPGAFVFPWIPDRSIFRKLARKCEIPTLDKRGMLFSSRSARKWFSTTLTSLGIPTLLVDTFLRHVAHVGQFYTDVQPSAQLLALQRLPSLYPPPQTARGMEKTDGILNCGVDKPDGNCQTDSAKMIISSYIPTEPPAPAAAKSSSQTDGAGVCARGSLGLTEDGSSTPAFAGKNDPRISSQRTSGLALSKPVHGINSQALADFLEADAHSKLALARLLRGGAA